MGQPNQVNLGYPLKFLEKIGDCTRNPRKLPQLLDVVIEIALAAVVDVDVSAVGLELPDQHRKHQRYDDDDDDIHQW